MRLLLWLLAVALVVYLFRHAARISRSWRSDHEDTLRAERIQREYHVPAWAVEEPTGRRAPVEPDPPADPEVRSRYTEEPVR